MDAIVYVSKTGFTQRYAEMLSRELTLPVMSLDEARMKLGKGTQIIFLGWISADRICGLPAARKRYEVKAIGAVGLGPDNDVQISRITKANKPGGIPLFYLRGGFNMEKLDAFKRFVMKLFMKFVESDYKSGKHKMMSKEEGENMLESFNGPKDYVSYDNLAPMLEKCRAL
ncbi:MAG: hypothetical protein GX095_06115 [Clostridiales bacterium]|jgi:hypothetical protein|nr:hypothetical protein [Clostridiales bacterium]HOB64256.1 hypothetical protein [Clostridia bacterium]HOK82480.1 hypothetical protein [Clostridia bacterium]HOL61421.1 hypothetical protein [Clostridia bacterium]HPO54224.1 hypothetical protein [Clostridia bacterium]